MVKHTTFGHAAPTARALSKQVMDVMDSYKRVKGRSHTVEKRKAGHPQKPQATSQPCHGLLPRTEYICTSVSDGGFLQGLTVSARVYSWTFPQRGLLVRTLGAALCNHAHTIV